MKQRTAARLARTLWALTVVLAALNVALVVVNASEDPLFIVIAISMGIGYATVGALIASRQHGNPIGWLFLTIALGLMVGGFSEEYSTRGLQVDPGSLPGTTFALWLTTWAFFLALTPIPLVFLLFPTGRVHSPRWRRVPWMFVTLATVALVAYALLPLDLARDLGEPVAPVPNPIGIAGARDLLGAIALACGFSALALSLASVVSLFLRFRRARGDERQQIKWLAYVGIATVTCLLGLFASLIWAGSDAEIEESFAVELLWFAAFLCLAVGIPGASAIAILKYRLYDLDVVVKKTVVFGILVLFVTGVYFAVVLGLNLTLFGTGGTASVITLAATVVVALLYQPVRTWARRFADRVVYGRRATPYEVLSDFSDRLAGAYSADDVLPRMAQIMASGTGATGSGVWLRVGPELRPAATWPENPEAKRSVPLAGNELPSFPDSTHAFPVNHQGELLGALTLSVPPSDPLTPSQQKLVRDLAAQAGLVLRNVRLIEELRASRQRLVAAQDEERRRLERNIHDGAQQQLVALSVKLRLARDLSNKDPEKAEAMLAEIESATTETLEDLRDLARGVYPPLLADQGLPAALEAQVRRSLVPVELESADVGRLPQEVEAAVYFCTLEALQNVAKYAEASRVTVRLERANGRLDFKVQDDGRGFDPAAKTHGMGLQGMADRLDAVGGQLSVESSPGTGTTVAGRVPAGEEPR